MEERFVYADNAATTSVSPAVLAKMMPYFAEKYGNPSSLHSKGREAKEAVTGARERIAAALGARPSEIYFTSCGSEADNMAVKGAARLGNGKHIVTTLIEHHAVLNSMKALEHDGYEVTYLVPDGEGFVTPERVAAAVRDDTALVAVMLANNEIGTIEPVCEIAAAVKAKNRSTLVFTDAVQAVGAIPVDVRELGVDMLSLSGHKIHAPKGIGALYVRSGLRLPPLIDGGGQERGMRAGTENVPYIIGLAHAVEDAVNGLNRMKRVSALRDRLIDGILAAIPDTRLNGPRTDRLPGNVNVSFGGVDGESLLLLLDMAGICASAGSACASASLEPSHVLGAVGTPEKYSHGAIRFSLGDMNGGEDVDYILERLPGIIDRLRAAGRS